MTRIVPWVFGAVYGIVLLAGLYFVVGGLGGGDPLRLTGFLAGMAMLFVVEVVAWRAPRWEVWLLGVRLALFVVVVAFDESGLSRVLFVLVPFAAYLAFGRRVGVVLGGVALALLVGGFAVRVPGWYRDADHVSDVLMFSMGLVLALAMADVALRERRAASRVAELSAAAERSRMARDLHDSLGHHLTAVSIQLEKAAAFAERDAGVARQALADARTSVGRALEDVRASVGALRAEPARLVDALAGLAADGVDLHVDGEERGTDQATATALYRAAQEAVTNARRHGRAATVGITVTFGAHGTRLVVTDDGIGFDVTTPRDGFGLLGLRERAALLGGTATVDSTPGAGTRVVVTVPAILPP
ncbi:sensor histidine kinase [Actinophytocola oryzae]|uniref:histidine kinase n=1 Tax=Actinophytocola oryzae TaxID=502181 RepID=A0A4V3FV12_9PSEU|nr:sensor histidine kinase [Actinophytocola oryzae]TDV57231.1 signal transduction histidine kinase [Actinophytocola oryzae]